MSVAARAIRPDVQAMSGYHVADATGYVKLDAMENPYRLPESLRDELARRLAAVALNRYPVPSYARLKDTIAATQRVPEGFSLVLGNGSDELIAMLSTLVAQPDAVVLAPVPGFVMYELSSRLAGLRLGYLVGRVDLLAELDKVRPPYNVNVLTEAAAAFALEHHDALDAQADRIRAARRAVYDALSRLPGVQPFPSRANFILFRVADPQHVMAVLRQRRVLIKDVSRQHPLLAGCLRVTVGTLEENRAFLAALAEALGAAGAWTDF